MEKFLSIYGYHFPQREISINSTTDYGYLISTHIQ